MANLSTTSPVLLLMKHIVLLSFFALVLSCFSVGCESRKAEKETTNGIRAAQTGYTRESVYQLQDRTFRQLAY
jgi:hypothetical protein